MEISVIIPTYNRSNILLEALDSLEQQSIDKKDYEIIIVNDGSTDQTSVLLKKYISKHNGTNIKYFKQKNSGPSKARNLGIKYASGRIIVFIGDDILCPENFLKNHIMAHQEKDISVTGPQIWTEKSNEFMRILVNNEQGMKMRKDMGMAGFCTANVSIEKRWLFNDKFDEDLRMGFEDSELGYRLIKKGVRMIFESSTKVYHKHYYDLEAFRRKQKMHGKAVPIFISKHFELKDQFVPKYRKLKRAICKILVGAGVFQRVNKGFYAKMEYLINYVDGIEEKVKELNMKF